MKKIDKYKAFIKIVKEVENDPEVAKSAEEAQRRFGTLTGDELKRRFTI